MTDKNQKPTEFLKQIQFSDSLKEKMNPTKLDKDDQSSRQKQGYSTLFKRKNKQSKRHVRHANFNSSA